MDEFFTQFWNLIVTFINPLNLIHPEKYTEALRTTGALWPSVIAVNAMTMERGLPPVRRCIWTMGSLTFSRLLITS